MESQFAVEDRVLATIKGFEPWPATVDNIVSEANKQNETYYIRLDGSYKSVPINVRGLKPLKPCDEEEWSWMCNDERWHEARKRIEVVEGLYITVDNDGDNIPPTLWNFVAADCQYEAVSNSDKATLQLQRVAHNAKVRYSELQSKFEYHKNQNEVRWRKAPRDDSDEFLLVDDGPQKSEECFQPITVIRFRCPKCSKKYKTRMALKKHMELNSCRVPAAAPAAPAATATLAHSAPALPHRALQCPKCFSLYPNQELLLKHMTVHQKGSPSKKKNGLRDHLRQAMTTSRGRMGSYYPKSKAGERAPPTAPPDPKRRKISSPEDSDEDTSQSEEDSWKECRNCLSRKCVCPRKRESGPHREVHNKREQERRFQMKHEFENLAEILGVADSGRSKHLILVRAKEEILDLEANRTKLEQTLNDLKDMNIRLVSREYQLR